MVDNVAMLKKPEQVLQEALARSADREVAGSKLLSHKIHDYACARRARGEVEIALKELAEMAGLGPWRAQVKDRLLPMLREAPKHPPLDGFVTEWSIGADSVRLRWDVAAPGEQIH